MAALESFHALVKVEVPMCSGPLLDQHLRETARSFCSRAGIWTAALAPVDLVAGTASYALASPEAQSEVARVIDLTVAGVWMWRDVDSYSKAQEYGRPRYRRDDPPFLLSPNFDQITLLSAIAPTADVTGGLEMSAVLQPSKTATTLPDALLNQYGDAMRVGALSRLLALGAMPWTDRALAVSYRYEFQQLLANAAYQGTSGNTSKAIRVKKWG